MTTQKMFAGRTNMFKRFSQLSPSQPRPEKRSDSLILYIDWRVPVPVSNPRVCIALTEMGKDFFTALVLHVFLSR